ncbi:MAG: protoporphyrinogen oxidase [Actinobacteria bacterium]|nr:protoporphyrinogen oxidase [Actinomycetota bacterium]MCB9412713.1 protoporphyrinogen oxidase [Actinomycetota bacterium]
MADLTDRYDVAVIGGGITGLAAGLELLKQGDCDVTVFESAEQVGGKLQTTDIGSVTVDAGAESMLAVRPEALRMAAEVGLKPSIVHPASRTAYVLSGGHLRELPVGLVSGVPTDMRSLAAARIMSLPGLLRIPIDQLKSRPEVADDVSVGEFISERMGREVVDRLTEPLLAGVYAGNPDELSLRMVNPSLFRQLARDKSLLQAARAVRSGSAIAAGARRGPVFAGLRNGVARLASKSAEVLVAQGAHVRTGCTVKNLRRSGRRWQVTGSKGTFEFDAVVLAVPAAQAATLLRTSAPFAAAQLRSIDAASVAVVTLAYRTSQVPELAGTGFLVPPIEDYHVKGVTFVTNKWEWAARAAKTATPRGLTIVRASYGRYGDDAVLERDDEALASLARAELGAIVGLPPVTVDHRVTRWSKALPQYRVGHVDVVNRARESLADAPGVALAGASYDGVGIASCIASGRQAAKKVARELSEDVVENYG